MRSKGKALSLLIFFPLWAFALEAIWVPNRILQGEMEACLLRAIPPLEATLGREALPVVQRDGVFVVLVAVDLAHPPGPKEVLLADRRHRAAFPLRVVRRPVKTSSLRLPERLFRLSPEDLKRIKEEKALIRRVLSSGWEEDALWEEGFLPPLEGKVSGEFALRRIVNGQYESLHTGVDIAAPQGTPVRAANRGRVVFASALLLEGNTVIIDHGLGLYSLYCHLDRILTKEGERVERGEAIGTVGATGRATGPHLHWAIRFRNKRISPESLLACLGEGQWKKRGLRRP